MKADAAARFGAMVVLSACLATAAMPRPASAEDGAQDRRNAPEHLDKPYVVLVSIDGFRWDFADLYGAENIRAMERRGLRAEALVPVYPTLTFPNHYSIATGRLPAHHGVVANTFPDAARKRWYTLGDRSAVGDGSWYLAEPLWVTAERHGMLTAAFYFVGTEADVGGIRPTHWRAFDKSVAGTKRVDQVLSWLAEPPSRRPHLLTLYFEDVDDQTHWYGPGSPESRASIARVDDLMGRLQAGIASLPHADRVYVVLVSDHGSAARRPDREPFILEPHGNLAGIRAVDGGSYVNLFADGDAAARLPALRDAINAAWDCGRAYLPGEAPAAWQVREGGRFPDLIVQAEVGCSVASRTTRLDGITHGDHGWPPDAPDMWGVFYATGPRFRPGTTTGAVSVLDVHPLLSSLLELPAPGMLDGDPARLTSLLKPEPGR